MGGLLCSAAWHALGKQARHAVRHKGLMCRILLPCLTKLPAAPEHPMRLNALLPSTGTPGFSCLPCPCAGAVPFSCLLARLA